MTSSCPVKLQPRSDQSRAEANTPNTPYLNDGRKITPSDHDGPKSLSFLRASPHIEENQVNLRVSDGFTHKDP